LETPSILREQFHSIRRIMYQNSLHGMVNHQIVKGMISTCVDTLQDTESSSPLITSLSARVLYALNVLQYFAFPKSAIISYHGTHRPINLVRVLLLRSTGPARRVPPLCIIDRHRVAVPVPRSVIIPQETVKLTRGPGNGNQRHLIAWFLSRQEKRGALSRG